MYNTFVKSNVESNQLTANQIICRMAELDLINNKNAGNEYTGFKGLYNFLMMNKKHVSLYGTVYDVTDTNINEHHLLKYLDSLNNENPSPVIMTSGTFLNMNKPLQEKVVIYLKKLSEITSVTIYVGISIHKLFSGSNVNIKVINREKNHIIHFIKTSHSFNFVMPHTEDKVIRVDLNSQTFKPQNKNRILNYFDKLIAKLDKEIESGKKAE